MVFLDLDNELAGPCRVFFLAGVQIEIQSVRLALWLRTCVVTSRWPRLQCEDRASVLILDVLAKCVRT